MDQRAAGAGINSYLSRLVDCFPSKYWYTFFIPLRWLKSDNSNHSRCLAGWFASLLAKYICLRGSLCLWKIPLIIKSIRTINMYLGSRRPVPSTDQAIPSCFYFRISWILMEQRCFYFFCPLGFLEGLRSLKQWLLRKVSIKNLDQKFKFLIQR